MKIKEDLAKPSGPRRRRPILFGLLAAVTIALAWVFILKVISKVHPIIRAPSQSGPAVRVSPVHDTVVVLAIDGGGIRGIIAARILEEIEKRLGSPLVESVDLVAGTSTGAIIGSLMAYPDSTGKPRFTMKQIGDIYRVKGPELLAGTPLRTLITADGLFGPRLSSKRKLAIFEEFDTTLHFGGLIKPVALNSYDLKNHTPLVLKNWDQGMAGVRLPDVLSAATAAPTIFQPIQIRSADHAFDYVLVDAGFYENSSGRIALKSAFELFPDRKYIILSVGTGKFNPEIDYHNFVATGRLGWLSGIFPMIVNATTLVGDDTIERFSREDANRITLFRLNPLLTDPISAFDASPSNIDAIERVAREFIAEKSDEIEQIVNQLRVTKEARHREVARRGPD